MTERPILFSAPMVRALLAGRKTQTRRAVRPQPDLTFTGVAGVMVPMRKTPDDARLGRLGEAIRCPFGIVGDRLWVREAFGLSFDGSALPWTGADPKRDAEVIYRATFGDERPQDGRLPWKPSIHMPRWASRITLEVTEVRVERLQAISAGDCYAEGIEAREVMTMAPIHDYRDVWNAINGPGAWDANPWVWVVSFRSV